MIAAGFEVELDVLGRDATGAKSWRVPAFWAGGDEWRVRFAAPAAGDYRVETICSDPSHTTAVDAVVKVAQAYAVITSGLQQAKASQ